MPVTPLVSLLAGTVFGFGLALSGMSNPAKVIGFLDVAGGWDPTLLAVMAGALAVTVPGFWLVRRRARPWFADRFRIPSKKDLDPRLLIGAVLFGVGWGIAGFCPGPAFSALASARVEVAAFVAAMIAGAVAHKLFDASAGAAR